MAEVRPLKSIRYNPARLDLSKAICPPYDVISPKREQELLDSSAYNYIRVEFPKAEPGDDEKNNKYLRAASALEKWLDEGVLLSENEPIFYLHEHYFTFAGVTHCRRGLFARVRLQPWEKMVVRPHENTLAGPKADRVNLLWALEADTSPVFGLYQDPAKTIEKTLESVAVKKPSLEFAGEPGESHKAWLIKDSGTIKAIEAAFADKALYIADGHHRYESALKYCQERRACSPELDDEAPLNFVLMALVDFNNAGLFILPTHRMVKGIDPAHRAGMLNALEAYFNIDRVTLEYELSDSQTILLYGIEKGRLIKLAPKNAAAIAGLMPGGHTPFYQKLDVSLVDHVILSGVLSMNPVDEVKVAYSHSRSDVFGQVDRGEFELAIIVNRVRPETIKEISDVGDKMPRKSTYFYPKLPSGLVAYRLK